MVTKTFTVAVKRLSPILEDKCDVIAECQAEAVFRINLLGIDGMDACQRHIFTALMIGHRAHGR